MPGLNTIISFARGIDKNNKGLNAILDKMNYDQSYFHDTLFGDSSVMVSFSGYPGYPQYKFEQGDKTIIIEGAIYNKNAEQIKTDLFKILPDIAGGGKTDRLAEFMFATDGEYIVYYIDSATSTTVIFNDALGRLPVYYYADSNGFIIARALKFLTENLNSVAVDDFALIEYFLFSTPLGDRTFFKDIFRLMPCSLLIVNDKDRTVKKQTLYRYNFDERWEDRPQERYIKDLHDLFLESVSSRAHFYKDRTQILSLSGGLDSRANLMGLLKSKVDFQAISFTDFYNMLHRDKAVVETLVKMYGFKFKPFELIEENIPYFERMVALKDGMSPMGTMGSVLYSMEVIAREYGRNIVYYTGDEGNYTIAPRYGGPAMNCTTEVIEQILAKNSLSVYSIKDVAAIFRKSPREVTDYLVAYFDNYPEKDNFHKVDHYFYWERSFKFTMENQDRIRLFFPPVAPHYGIKYVRYALKIGNKHLGGWKTYAGLLESLDKRSVGVKYANFGIPLNSPLMPFYLPLRSLATSNETVRHNIRHVMRVLRHPTQIGRKTRELGFVGELKKYLADVIRADQSLDTILDTTTLQKQLTNEQLLYKMYITGNAIKYLSLVPNKEKA